MSIGFIKSYYQKFADIFYVEKGNDVMPSFDYKLLMTICGLLLFGLVMVYSATISLAGGVKFQSYSITHFVCRQAVFICLGILAGCVVFQFKVETWRRFALLLCVAGLLLLILVLVPGIGRVVGNSRRWISLVLFNVQPSELMKPCMLIFVSAYVVGKQDVMHKLIKGFLPLGLVLICTATLLLLEPDLGATIVIISIAMGVLFIGGFSLVWFVMGTTLFTSLFAGAILFSAVRRGRFLAFLNPWDPSHALDKAYQLTHSLIAFGRGEIFGVGLGASVEKLHYLPEAHTDFIMAVIGEELGLVGVVTVICVLFWVVKRAFEIGRQAVVMDRVFSGLLSYGVGIWFGTQTIFHAGVNMGLLPTKGLTLPFISYGGSGILVNCMAIALLLRIDYENRLLMQGKTI